MSYFETWQFKLKACTALQGALQFQNAAVFCNTSSSFGCSERAAVIVTLLKVVQDGHRCSNIKNLYQHVTFFSTEMRLSPPYQTPLSACHISFY